MGLLLLLLLLLLVLRPGTETQAPMRCGTAAQLSFGPSARPLFSRGATTTDRQTALSAGWQDREIQYWWERVMEESESGCGRDET